jgi:flagellin-like hook-associated protein FlgL
VNDVKAGDFNGDGHQDILVTGYNDSNVALILGNGDGTFTDPVSIAQPANPHRQFVTVGDYNKDGSLDFAVSNYTNNQIEVFLGNTADIGGTTTSTTTASATIDLTTADKAELSYFVAASVSLEVSAGAATVAGNQTRLGEAVTLLASSRDASLAAKNGTLEVNTADEKARLTHNLIIADANTAMFAQANLSAGRVLELLSGDSTGGGQVGPADGIPSFAATKQRLAKRFTSIF